MERFEACEVCLFYLVKWHKKNTILAPMEPVIKYLQEGGEGNNIKKKIRFFEGYMAKLNIF